MRCLQSMFLWKVGRHRPGSVADVYASGKQLLPNGPDAKAIAVRLGLDWKGGCTMTAGCTAFQGFFCSAGLHAPSYLH